MTILFLHLCVMRNNLRVNVTIQEASYDSCKNVKSGNTDAINLICDSLDCDLDDFYVSLGINKFTDLKVFYEIYDPESESNIISRFNNPHIPHIL